MNLNFFTPDPRRRTARLLMKLLAAGMLLVSVFYVVVGFRGAKEYGLQSGWGYRLKSLSEVERSVSDYEPVWQGNAYVLKGINPFEVMNGRADYDSEIGPIVKGTANVPWTYGLSNLWIPGFLSFETAGMVSLIWWVLLWAIAASLLWRKMKELGIDDPLFASLLVLTMFCQCSIGAELETLNPAFLVIPTLFIVCLSDDKKHPYWVGICLALAMIKPQLTALFFIPFIVKGNYKTVLTGGVLVFLSLMAVSLRLGENPIALTMNSFSEGFDASVATTGEMGMVQAASQGIFSAFFPNVIPLSSATLWHWVIFIPYTFLLCWRFRKAPFYLLFSIPFVISMLWMYSLPLNRSTALLWMSVMIFLYTWGQQEKIGNRKTLVAYILMGLLGFPLMSGVMARMLGTFMIWPIAALLIFVVLHIVLWWYLCSEKKEKTLLETK